MSVFIFILLSLCVQPSSGPAQWVVLADYEGTEPGMLSVSEGELVELLDTSDNAWSLVKPVSRPTTDGWIPMAYIAPYAAEGYSNPNHTPSLRYHSVSSSEESDTPTEVFEHPPLLSPEVLERYDSEEKRASAEEKRM